MKDYCKSLPAIWIVVIAYQIITIILIGLFRPEYYLSPAFIVSRFIILVYLARRPKLKSQALIKNVLFLDTLIIYVLLTVFYGETAQLNTFMFQKIDPTLCMIDGEIFGFQPSVVFSMHFGNAVFSEIMFFGYFSYYLMPACAFLLIWIYQRPSFEKFSFIILSSYFIYYMIYIIIPSEGPQFYFQFPTNHVQAQGLFGFVIKLIQKNGEAPTAAFPSSHIGISVIMLILLFKNYKSLFRLYLPFVGILFFSTVYIKAHYFIDVVAGLISAPIVLALVKLVYTQINSSLNTVLHVDRN